RAFLGVLFPGPSPPKLTLVALPAVLAVATNLAAPVLFVFGAEPTVIGAVLIARQPGAASLSHGLGPGGPADGGGTSPLYSYGGAPANVGGSPAHGHEERDQRIPDI